MEGKKAERPRPWCRSRGKTAVSWQHATRAASQTGRREPVRRPTSGSHPVIAAREPWGWCGGPEPGGLGHNVEAAGCPSQSPSPRAGCVEPGAGRGRELCPPRATRQQPLRSGPQEPRFWIKFQVRAAHAHQSPPPPRLPSPQHSPGPSPPLLINRRPPHLES